MDGQRQPYIPGPPPPPSMPQNGPQGHLMSLLPPPPPPPRLPQNTGHANMGFPPPPPPPASGYGGQPSWQRQPSMTHHPYPPPPPPILTGQNHSQYTHLSYSTHHGRTPAPLTIPPPPTERPPLVSATYIPESGTFGPGVGIPGLFTNNDSGGYSDGTGGPGHSRKQSYTDQSDHPHPLSTSYRPSHDNVASGPPTATLQNPHGQISVTSDYADTHYFAAGGTFLNSMLNQDLADRWPINHVLLWLAQNGFSKEWQETFKALDLKGADFIELGRRGKIMGKFHQIIYPQLARECTKSKIPFDHSGEREEGKRLVRLIRAIAEGHDPDHGIILPSASTDGGLENSPNLAREVLSAFPNSTATENSPGQQFVKPASLSPAQRQFSATLAPSAAGHVAYERPPNEPNQMDQTSRSEFSRNILSLVGEDSDRQGNKRRRKRPRERVQISLGL